jgi:polyisoprenyl-phosphate glycosyltransferase
MKKKISLICPCYNESENIIIFYNKIKSIFRDNIRSYDYEIIFVDDDSRDNSMSLLENIANNDINCKVLFNSRNYGVHRSTFNAIKYATGDMLIPMLPVDMQDDPELITIFVEKIEEGFDIVYGIKKEREENFFMKLIRNFYYKIVTKISNANIPPYVGEFQLIQKHIYKELLNFDDYYPYTRGIIATLSSNSVGINYTWKKRIKGKSKTSLLKLLDMGINGLISFSNFPIRIFTILGILISLISFIFIIAQLVTYFYIHGRMSTPGISTLIVATFFFSGIQFLFLGILGEYICAIHSQVRKPKNIVTLKRSLNIENINKVIA